MKNTNQIKAYKALLGTLLFAVGFIANGQEVAETLSWKDVLNITITPSSNGTTTGFYNEYDKGVTNNFVVGTKAVNSQRNLEIPSLPQGGGYENTVIPVEVNAKAKSTLTFSVNAKNLPAGTHVYLEDRINNKFEKIDNGGAYTVTPTSDLNGTGRFFIHTSSNDASLAVRINPLNHVNVYVNNGTLKIKGITQGQASIRIYSILGKRVMNTTITGNGDNRLTLPRLETGVYLLQVQSTSGALNKKLVIK